MPISEIGSPASLSRTIWLAETMDFGGYSTRDAWSAAEAVLGSEWLRAVRAAAWQEGHTAGYTEAKDDGEFYDLETKTANPYQPSPDSEPRG